MKNVSLFFLSMSFVLFTSCGNDLKKTESEPEVVIVDNSEKEAYTPAKTEVTFKDDKVGEVFSNYILLKTALVNSDPKSTATHASELMTNFANIGVADEVLTATQSIYETEDVEVQRTAFVIVTAAVEKMLEGAIESGVIYKQYCPMAFDFEGAFWLSNSKEIYNPYFGDKMLRCGKVDSEIK